MSNRKPGYLIGVILLALVMSAPQLLVTLQMGAEAFFGIRGLPFRSRLLGVGSPVLFGGSIWSATCWRDQFVFISDVNGRTDGTLEWVVSSIDIETGKMTDLDLEVSARNGIVPIAFGDRLWLVGHNGIPQGNSFELVEGAFQPATFVVPTSQLGDEQRFLLDGEAAYVAATPGSGFQVSTFTAGTWGNNRDVVLPTRYHEETFDFKYVSHLSCVNQGDRIHVFLHYGRRLFYHDGLELQPVDATEALLNREVGDGATAVEEAVSALRVANSDGATTGWTLVREQPNALPTIYYSHQDVFGMLVGGQPAALIVDDPSDLNPVGHLYRFDGTAWSEFATQTFPFGTNQLRVLPGHGGQKSYIVASSTRTGAAHLFAVESTGIRATKGASQHNNSALNTLRGYAMVPVAMLMLGIILGVGTWCLMWWYTKPDYGFGVQTVKLASLGRRGLARVIDLGLILFTTAGLCWAMTRGFDWLALLEALHLQVDHPTITIAARVASILALWLAVLVLSLLVAQARWGLTPGKWLCGLRTLRTTLRPCGFARSLVREVVLSVDACHFLCWTPGIVCIALTDCRQRLGDLVADTIVVEAASLRSGQ